ncbi:UvrD-helicase domain-containing protein [Arthrospira platensis BEA 1257B]
MNWTISFTNTFISELLNLPKSVQKKAEKSLKKLQKDPIYAIGDVKKLKGYTNNVYRVRIGDYRLLYCFGDGWVKLLSVRKRDDRTYDIELTETDSPTPPPDRTILEPQPQPVIAESAVTPPESTLITTALPFKLTKSILKKWQIPPEYWSEIISAPNSEALLELPISEQYIQRIIDNLYPRPIEEIISAREYILNQPEDLERFAEGTLTSFLLKLDPEQEKLIKFGKGGPILVKGGPGTGKSTLAIYRVQTLVYQGITPILFTTYTRALVSYSEQLLTQLLGTSLDQAAVQVSTVDSLTYNYYIRNHEKPKFATNQQCLYCLQKALQTAEIPGKNRSDRIGRQETLKHLGLPYLLEEIQETINGWGVATQEEYLALSRTGRGVPLSAKLREALWSVYQTWEQNMTKMGYITWPQLRRKAMAAIAQLSAPPYEAIVIDEAQDLSPVALRCILALVPSLKNVYLTADASQSLYQRGFSWKKIHRDLNVTGRTLTLTQNYRNTAQIITATNTILEGTSAGDADCLQPTPSDYQGEIPTIILTENLQQETQRIRAFFMAAAKRHRLPIHGGAILCPRSEMAKNIARELTRPGQPSPVCFRS